MRIWLAPASSAAVTKSSCAQREEAPAHDAGQRRPADDAKDEHDDKVDAFDGPVGGHGGGQRHPERNRGDRTHDFDEALDDVVDGAAVEAGDAAQQDAQEEAQGHADQTDGQREARGHHQAREEIAAQLVRAEEKERLLRVAASTAPIRWMLVGIRPNSLYSIALGEELQVDLDIWVGRVDFLEGLGVALAVKP